MIPGPHPDFAAILDTVADKALNALGEFASLSPNTIAYSLAPEPPTSDPPKLGSVPPNKHSGVPVKRE